ncbi:TPA: hypothetical protein ACOQZT_002229, partial [Serratia odorifera]
MHILQAKWHRAVNCDFIVVYKLTTIELAGEENKHHGSENRIVVMAIKNNVIGAKKLQRRGFCQSKKPHAC